MAFGTGAGPVHALANVTLHVGRGELVALIGPSGCGKSTLLRLIADVLQPSGGAIEVRGGPPVRARLAREFGFAFQHPGLFARHITAATRRKFKINAHACSQDVLAPVAPRLGLGHRLLDDLDLFVKTAVDIEVGLAGSHGIRRDQGSFNEQMRVFPD